MKPTQLSQSIQPKNYHQTDVYSQRFDALLSRSAAKLDQIRAGGSPVVSKSASGSPAVKVQTPDAWSGLAAPSIVVGGLNAFPARRRPAQEQAARAAGPVRRRGMAARRRSFRPSSPIRTRARRRRAGHNRPAPAASARPASVAKRHGSSRPRPAGLRAAATIARPK